MIHKRDLPNLTGMKRTEPDPFLYCENCSGRYSANAGDYWHVSPGHIFRCCGVPMRLVRAVTHFEDVQV